MNYLKAPQKIAGILTLLICFTNFSIAQVVISGQIQDMDGNSLPFTNVILLDHKDSSLIMGTVSDNDGQFTLNNVSSGGYLLKAMMIGYQPAIKNLNIDGEAYPELIFEMRESIQELNEVVIKAQKPLYEKQSDRTVVNVQSRISSTGKSALEILSKSPGVLVNKQNNSLSLYGKNGVMVMINGKMSRMPEEAVIQMLNGMSAANIEKIELITSPPAKYDAEGNAGIINIVMVENADYGTNGNVGITAGYNQGETYGGNFSLNHRGSRLNLFTDYSILLDHNEQPWLDSRIIYQEIFDQRIVSDQQRDAWINTQNLRAGIEYELTKKTKARMLLTGYYRNWDLNGFTTNINQASPDSTLVTLMDVYESNVIANGATSFGLSHKLNEDHNLSFTTDILHQESDNPSNYKTTTNFKNTSIESEIDVTKDTPIDLQVFALDYEGQINKDLFINAGLKSSISKFINDVAVKNLIGDGWVEMERFTSNAQLQENIYAGFTSFDWSISDQTKMYGGLRYEFTYSNLDGGETVIDRKYGNFFPSLSLSRKLSDQSNLNFSYSRRISRPTFNDIAPFVYFAGPNTFFSGNPVLLPAISDGVDLSYQLNSWWISVKFSSTKDFIMPWQPELDSETSQQVYRSQNIDNLKLWSFTASLPVAITSWWEFQGDATLNYQLFEASYLNNFSENTLILNLNGTNTITLPENFTLEVSGNYVSSTQWGLWKFFPMGQLDVGVKKSWDKSSLTLSFTDVLHTNVWRGEALFSNSFSSWEYDMNARSVNLTFSMRFGNKKLRSVNIKSVSEEERKRVN